MAVEAPISRWRLNNLKLYIAVCLILAAWLAYDGFINKEFISAHTDADGKKDSTLYWNQKGTPILAGAAVVLAFYYLAVRNRKITADETELKIPAGDPIAYDKIESIDKTYFAKKGYFVLNYKDWKDRPASKKISDRSWDNLAAVLDHLTAKLQG